VTWNDAKTTSLQLRFTAFITFVNVLSCPKLTTLSVTNSTPFTSTNVINAVNLNCSDVVFASFQVTGECANSPLNVINQSKGAIEEYLYDFGNGVSSQLEEPIIFFDEAGTYTVEQQVSNELIEVSFSVDVTIVENTLPPISIIENDESLIASLVSDNYTWYFNGEEIEGENGRTIAPDEEGTYRVTYERSGEGCLIRSSQPYTFLVTSLEDDIVEEEIRAMAIYPNPVNDYLFISNIDPRTEIFVYSLEGKVIPIDFQKDGDGVRVDVRDLQNGLYIINISVDGRIVKDRFIKD
jgi:hypothetical protein